MRQGTALGFIALSTALLSGGGWAQVAPDGEAGLRAANVAEVSELLAADDQGLDRLWAESFVVTNPLNHFVAKAQVLDMVRSGTLRFSAYQRSIEYLRQYGDIAVVAGAETVRWAGHMPLAGKVSHLRFTAVWRRTGVGWEEIARHANIVR